MKTTTTTTKNSRWETIFHDCDDDSGDDDFYMAQWDMQEEASSPKNFHDYKLRARPNWFA
jgi:hypothetical protein